MIHNLYIKLMQFPKQYPYAVAVALTMSLHAWREAFGVGNLRKALFNEAFMKKQFGQTHKKQLGFDITMSGYPDTGSGPYSQKLSYRDWYKFNIYQRVHQNYVESLSFAQTSLLSAAIYKPKEAAAVGLLFIVGRIIYSFFYKKEKGALNKGRILGSILSLLAIFVNSGIFFTNFFKSLK